MSIEEEFLHQSLMDPDQAAELLSVPPSWIMRQARAGKLPHVKLGHYTRFERGALDAWLANQRRGT
jgi:excisionase family DNA binding protein